MQDGMGRGAEPAALLTVDTVGAYAVRRGLIPDASEAQVASLGGVSNVVLAVRADDRQVVVKQALPRLRVAEEWSGPWIAAHPRPAMLEMLERGTQDG